MKICLYHRESDKWYWYDLSNEGMYHDGYTGGGYIYAIPAGEEMKRVAFRRPENMVCLDPIDCDIFPLISAHFCCHLDCDKTTPAEWLITTGCSPDDYTHSCTKHAKELSEVDDMPPGFPKITPIDNLCDIVDWSKNIRNIENKED